MNVTQKLMEIDKTLTLHNEGAWDKPLKKNKPGFTSFNDAGVETETGEFLYSMIRMLKPKHVLETGTHWGIGASYMGQALKENNEGQLDTIEFLPEIHRRAIMRMIKLELMHQVTCHLNDARGFDTEGKIYDFILLDTEPQTRFEELIKYFDCLKPGGYIFIHDLHRHMHQIPNEEHGFAWPFGEIPEQIKSWVKDGELRPMHFSTPRGFTGFYKPSPSDYKWE